MISIRLATVSWTRSIGPERAIRAQLVAAGPAVDHAGLRHGLLYEDPYVLEAPTWRIETLADDDGASKKSIRFVSNDPLALHFFVAKIPSTKTFSASGAW